MRCHPWSVDVRSDRRCSFSRPTPDVRHATVVLTPADDGGCEIRLRSSLAPAARPLRSIIGRAPWLARFGHGWLIDRGVRQFRDRAR
jgi:hypothetical protein